MNVGPEPRPRWYVQAFQAVAQILADFFIVGAGYFNSTVIPELGILGLILGVVRLNRRARRGKIVFILYWIGVILTLDFTYTVVGGGLMQANLVLNLLIIILYIGILYLRRALSWFHYLTPLQLFVVPLVLFGINVKIGELSTTRSACYDINKVPGMRVLTDRRYNHTQIPHTAIPRYFVYRPKRHDMLVCNHIYVYEESILLKKAINRLDLRTGVLHPWFKKGEVLAIREEKDTGRIYAIIQKNYRDSAAPNVELIVFSADGDILDRKDFGFGRPHFIGGSIVILPNKVICHVETSMFEYDKQTRKLHKLKIDGWPESPIYRTEWSPPYWYGVYATTVIYNWIHGERHAIKVDTRTNRVAALGKDNPFGYYDIAKIPGKEEFVVSRHTREGGFVLDSHLRKIRRLNIPAGVREIEISSDGRYLLASSLLKSDFYVIDLKKNKVVATTYIGSGGRGLLAADDDSVFLGTSCGVVSVDLKKFLIFKLRRPLTSELERRK